MPAGWTSEQKAGEFLTQIAKSGVAAATQSQALNALVFLYGKALGTPLGNVEALRVKRPATVRTALAVEEVRALLANVEDVDGYPTRLVVRLLYGCGLRVSEPLELRIKDVEMAAGRLVVREGSRGDWREPRQTGAERRPRSDSEGVRAPGGGARINGNKDRIVLLPECLRGEMEAQLRVARAVAKADAAAKLPVALPGRLRVKYSRAPFDAVWGWVFPGDKLC